MREAEKITMKKKAKEQRAILRQAERDLEIVAKKKALANENAKIDNETREEEHNLIPEKDDNRTVINGLTDYLINAKSPSFKRILVGSVDRDFIYRLIKKYFDSLDDFAGTCDREQLLADLQIMSRNGQPQATKLLFEYLNLDAVSESYDFNMINYKDVEYEQSFYDFEDGN